MFSGIVIGIGRVLEIQRGRDGTVVMVKLPRAISHEAVVGDSVAVDGVCLTVESRRNGVTKFRIMPTTEAYTTLGSLRAGTGVNIELPLRWRGRVGGHYVHGHVDGVGRVIRRVARGGGLALAVRIPAALTKFLVTRGSVALNGVSLTVTRMRGNTITVSLMKTTLARTNLARLELGDRVNIETDLLAKYALARKRL